MNRHNITSETLESVRRTILFIETEVSPTEMSKALRTRLNKFLSELKTREIELETYLINTGGNMSGKVKEDINDTTECTIHD